MEPYKTVVSSWIHVGRPGFEARKRLIMHSLLKLQKEGLGKHRTPVELDPSISGSYIANLASKIEGFAGRDIKMKLIDTLERELACSAEHQKDGGI